MYRIFILCLLISLGSCLEPLSTEVAPHKKKLVVDGLITDRQDLQTIKLYYTVPLESTTARPEYLQRATVEVISTEQVTVFNEAAPGKYQNADFCGVVGETYTLRITTEEGDVYESSPQVMASSGSIQDIYYEYKKDAIIKSVGEEQVLQDAYLVYLDGDVPEQIHPYVRWRWKMVYKGETHPELYYENGVNGPIPAPLPCSGYVHAGGSLRKVGECICCICWATEFSEVVLINNGLDNIFVRSEIAQIPVTPMRFYEKVFIELEQISISEEVYEFWKLVKAQNDAAGSLFQPSSIRIKGNIKSVTNPAEEVFGIFSVSSISTQSLFIEKSELPFPTEPLDTIMYDCRTYLPNATNTKPTFW